MPDPRRARSVRQCMHGRNMTGFPGICLIKRDEVVVERARA
jgi:hypothetical protein